MALAADHQVIVDRDAQRLGGSLDLARHLDVVARRLGIEEDSLSAAVRRHMPTRRPTS